VATGGLTVVTKSQPSQRIPTAGAFVANLDFPALREKLRGQSGVVHCYVVRTVEYPEGEFIQTGSGPNFQGGLITLCTCKRQMRSRKTVTQWPGEWVAGFTSVGKVLGDRVNHLVYLIKIGQAYASHRDLWNALSPDEREAKNAHTNPVGDVFEPRSPDGDWFDAQSYLPPSSSHVHCPDHYWLRDIDDHRRPPLLVGNREWSFVWSKPKVAWPQSKIARDYERHPMNDFLSHLA
jgi:hypothetical protein